MLVLQVLHEGDRRGVAAERGPREREAPGSGAEGLADGVAPAERVAAVVHLVEDHERATALGDAPVHLGLDGDLRVGHRDAVPVAGEPAVGVAELGVEPQADAVRSVGPLAFEVLGGGDDRDPVDGAPIAQLLGEAEREGRLAGAGGRVDEEVAGLASEVLIERFGLPGAQAIGGAPGRAAREGRGEVVAGRVVRRGAGIRDGIEGRRAHWCDGTRHRRQRSPAPVGAGLLRSVARLRRGCPCGP
ncbi:hypothetical protein GCM10025874_07600 [Arenivirga flava]|uniref:Uncharacterized protein n=1 Tax=Arenivirga flava TaxID=1930060 RepID=A0AA37UHX6_9MICO|nr:hypothetical protein GCM10025874_07600 [Arenivirga flava]